MSIRIASIGYAFMGISVAIQGILQAYRKSLTPLIISVLRLIVFLVPFALVFVHQNNAKNLVWWSFDIAEVLTAIIAFIILKYTKKEMAFKEESQLIEDF